MRRHAESLLVFHRRSNSKFQSSMSFCDCYSTTAGVFCRHRRVRRVNEESLIPIPMAVFNDEGDKCGKPVREAEGTVNYWFIDYIVSSAKHLGVLKYRFSVSPFRLNVKIIGVGISNHWNVEV